MAALKAICEHFGNRVFDSVRIPYSSDTRPHATWLSPDQARELLHVLERWLDARAEIVETIRLNVPQIPEPDAPPPI